MQLAYKIVMDGFAFLGWELSQSKLKEEGTMKNEGVLIGHHVETQHATRGVMLIKQERVQHVLKKMLGCAYWDRRELTEVTGLIESTRDDMRRHVSLRAMYQAIYDEGEVRSVSATKRGRSCMKKILLALPERRSLFARPTRWVIPAMTTVPMVPNGDASGQIGYSGVLWEGDELLYFHGTWSEEIRQKRVNIAFLEAWVVIMIAATWGGKFSGRKVVIRSDSMATCFALNKLWADHPGMEMMCQLWEDLQFFYGFEGLVLHCPGKENRLSDIGSRMRVDRMEQKLAEELCRLNMTDVILKEEEVTWRVGDVRVDVEEELLRL